MPKRGVYIAIDNSGDVYAGQSSDLNRRAMQHSKNGLTTIASFQIDTPMIMKTEKRLISFLSAQSGEEEFDCLNILLRK